MSQGLPNVPSLGRRILISNRYHFLEVTCMSLSVRYRNINFRISLRGPVHAVYENMARTYGRNEDQQRTPKEYLKFIGFN